MNTNKLYPNVKEECTLSRVYLTILFLDDITPEEISQTIKQIIIKNNYSNLCCDFDEISIKI